MGWWRGMCRFGWGSGGLSWKGEDGHWNRIFEFWYAHIWTIDENVTMQHVSYDYDHLRVVKSRRYGIRKENLLNLLISNFLSYDNLVQSEVVTFILNHRKGQNPRRSTRSMVRPPCILIKRPLNTSNAIQYHPYFIIPSKPKEENNESTNS